MGVCKAVNLSANIAVEMYVLLYVWFVRAVVAADRVARDAIGADELVCNAGIFKIAEYTIEGDPVNLIESGLELGMRECQMAVAQLFQYFDACRRSLETLTMYEFYHFHGANLHFYCNIVAFA